MMANTTTSAEWILTSLALIWLVIPYLGLLALLVRPKVAGWARPAFPLAHLVLTTMLLGVSSWLGYIWLASVAWNTATWRRRRTLFSEHRPAGF